MNWYPWIKYIHVLAAITAFGSNITYAVWNVRSARETEHLSFALRGIEFIDRRVANPAYGLALLTGLILVVLGHWWPQRWVISALVLFAVMIIVAVGFYSPRLRRQLQVLDKEGPTSPTFEKLTSQARAYGITTAVIVLVIVFLMVAKPTI